MDQISLAIAADRIEVAQILFNAVQKILSDKSSPATRQRLVRCQAQITTAETLLTAERGLKSADADSFSPAEHLLRGRYLCFNRGDWPHGMEHLALAKTGELSAVAAIDWSEPADAAEQFELAERWLACSVEVKSDAVSEQIAQASASYWYAEALSRLASLQRVKAQQELDRLNAAGLFLSRAGSGDSTAGNAAP
jgi:hypothetical protein